MLEKTSAIYFILSTDKREVGKVPLDPHIDCYNQHIHSLIWIFPDNTFPAGTVETSVVFVFRITLMLTPIWISVEYWTLSLHPS